MTLTPSSRLGIRSISQALINGGRANLQCRFLDALAVFRAELEFHLLVRARCV